MNKHHNIHKLFRPLAHTAIGIAATFLIAGCSLIPTYERPALPVAEAWPASAQAGAVASQAAPAWQAYFSDATLRQLIDTALAHNRDMRMAVLNIEQAKAQFGVRRADQYPSVNATVTGARTPNSNGAINSAYTGGLTVTAFELDFFGRVASLKEQALAQYLASEEAVQTARISLVATVAQTWLNLLADEALLASARQALETRQDSHKLVTLKHEKGAASLLDQQLAQTLLENARVALAQQTRQRALDENALVLLLGQPLTDGQRQQLTDSALNNVTFTALSAGLPSDLLTQRPDVRQAEHTLLASHANIGAARAAFFPRISLTAGAGSASSELAGLFKDGSWGWTLAPQLVLPIFDAGRNQANLSAANTTRELAVAQYEKTIQTAFREVADALASRTTWADQARAQQALLNAEAKRAELTQLRLTHGAASQLEFLDAQRSLFAAQQGAVQTRLAVLQNQVQLFKVLGGGSTAVAKAEPAPQTH